MYANGDVYYDDGHDGDSDEHGANHDDDGGDARDAAHEHGRDDVYADIDGGHVNDYDGYVYNDDGGYVCGADGSVCHMRRITSNTMCLCRNMLVLLRKKQLAFAKP